MLRFCLICAVAALSAGAVELPRVWTSYGRVWDDGCDIADLKAHGVDVVGVGTPSSVEDRIARIEFLRKGGLKGCIGFPDIVANGRRMRALGVEPEPALMLGGVYDGLALDRFLFKFAAKPLKITIEPPVYNSSMPFYFRHGKSPEGAPGGERMGHYYPACRPVRAEVIVPLKPYDGAQHLKVVPAKLSLAPPGAKVAHDSYPWKDWGSLWEGTHRKLYELEFDLTGLDGAMLDKVGVAVYWTVDPQDEHEQFRWGQSAPAAESTREAARRDTRRRLGEWKEANGGSFPSDVLVAVRAGDECYNVTGHSNGRSCNYPIWDFSESGLASFRKIARPGDTHPRTWGYPEIYGEDAYGCFLYSYHKACADVMAEIVRTAHEEVPGLIVMRNTTRGGIWSNVNDHDGSGQELLAKVFDVVHIDPYPVGAGGYNESVIPTDGFYASGLGWRYGKPFLPWLQAHSYGGPTGLQHVSPDDVAKMEAQYYAVGTDAIMWLGYGSGSTFPARRPKSWERAGEFHRRLHETPPERPQARLAVLRGYAPRAVRLDLFGGRCRGPADYMLEDFCHVWAVEHKLPFDVYEVPPRETDEEKATREATLSKYEWIVSTVPCPQAKVLGAGRRGEFDGKDRKAWTDGFRKDVDAMLHPLRPVKRRDMNGAFRFYIGGRKTFILAVEYRAEWSGGADETPSDVLMLEDIRRIKSLGFNAVYARESDLPSRFVELCGSEKLIVFEPQDGDMTKDLFVPQGPRSADMALGRHTWIAGGCKCSLELADEAKRQEVIGKWSKALDDLRKYGVCNGLAGACLGPFVDSRERANGLVTMDRRTVKIPESLVREKTKAIFDAFAEVVAKEDDPSAPHAVRPACRTKEMRWQDEWWMKRHADKLAEIKANADRRYDVVFVGDSITHNWETPGARVAANAAFSDLKILNLGYSGDRTQHILWRGLHGELDGYEARWFMVMAGVNNGDRPEDVAAGVKSIVALIRRKHPESKVLLLPIFPYGEKPNPQRSQCEKASALFKACADGNDVVWCDFNAKLLNPDGSYSKEMAGDYLHPTAKGYAVWAENVADYFRAAPAPGPCAVKLRKVGEYRATLDNEIPMPMAFCPVGQYRAKVEILPAEIRFEDATGDVKMRFTAPENVEPPYDFSVILTCAHKPATFVTKDGRTTLDAIHELPKGFDIRAKANLTGLRFRTIGGMADPRATLSAGIGQADVRFVTTGREGRPYREGRRLFFTFSVRGYGAYQGVASFDPDKFDVKMEGAILFDYGDGILRNDLASHLFFDDVAGEWRAYVSNFSTGSDGLGGRAKGGLNCAWSKECPIKGLHVMRAKSLGLDGMNEDPSGIYDVAAGKWRLFVSKFPCKDDRQKCIKAALFESDHWDGGFRQISGPVDADSTGTTIARMGDGYYCLSGSADRRYYVYRYPTLERLGYLDFSPVPWEGKNDYPHGRGWPAFVELWDGSSVRHLMLTMDRENFPGMPTPNWTYGKLFLYGERFERESGSRID